MDKVGPLIASQISVTLRIGIKGLTSQQLVRLKNIRCTPPTEKDVEEKEIRHALNCAVIVKIVTGPGRYALESVGNGVAVSAKKAISALHGAYGVGQPVQVVDAHGIAKNGIVSFMKYEPSKVDIAVIELSGSSVFTDFIPVHGRPVTLAQSIYVMSMRALTGDYTMCFRPACVEKIINGTSIFHSAYYSDVGMTGCRVVAVHNGTSFSLVGVQVGSHERKAALEVSDEIEENSEQPPKKTKLSDRVEKPETSQELLKKDKMTIDSNVHGHGAYCLICELARVEGLIEYLNDESSGPTSDLANVLLLKQPILSA